MKAERIYCEFQSMIIDYLTRRNINICSSCVIVMSEKEAEEKRLNKYSLEITSTTEQLLMNSLYCCPGWLVKSTSSLSLPPLALVIN